MKEKITQLAEKYFPRVKSIREHLHTHPELSFEEYETSKYIQERLQELGLEFKTDLGGGTGLYAEIGEGNHTIALRADIDALPIKEIASHDYKSQNEGVMHACGHDVHTSCLLGTAMILKELEDELPCRMRLIFQPGEEKLPGGASMMIKDGCLEGVSAIIGQHVHPDLEVGKIGYGYGNFMASCDEIYITITGKGGHAAMPEKVIDPILITSEIIQSLQSVISRRSNPNTQSVLSIGKINSVGGATNVIPDQVKLEGTFRTYDEAWRKEAHRLINSIITSHCEGQGASAEVNIVRGYPSLYNDPSVTEYVRSGIEHFLAKEDAIEIAPRMTAEDFSYYSHEIPASFYRLGTASKDGTNKNAVHTPSFDIDHEAMKIGVGLMSYLSFEIGRQVNKK